MIRLRNILFERVGSKELSAEKLGEILKNYLDKNYRFDEFSVEDLVEVIDQGFRLEVIMPQKVLNEEDWSAFFKKHGYFIKKIWGKDDKYPTVKVHLMPYKSSKIEKKDLPNTLYHVTPMNKILKIFEDGLVPKETQKVEGGVDEARVYFSIKKDKGFKNLKKQLKDKVPENPPFGSEVATIKVKTSKIRNGVEFYSDPEVVDDSFIFTKSYIRPEAIANESRIEYENEKDELIRRKYYS